MLILSENEQPVVRLSELERKQIERIIEKGGRYVVIQKGRALYNNIQAIYVYDDLYGKSIFKLYGIDAYLFYSMQIANVINSIKFDEYTVKKKFDMYDVYSLKEIYEKFCTW